MFSKLCELNFRIHVPLVFPWLTVYLCSINIDAGKLGFS